MDLSKVTSRLLREALAAYGDLSAIPADWIDRAQAYSPAHDVRVGYVAGFWNRGHLLVLLLPNPDSLPHGMVTVGPGGVLNAVSRPQEFNPGMFKGARAAERDEVLRTVASWLRPDEWDEARALARSVAHLWPASESTLQWLDGGGFKGAEAVTEDAWAYHVHLDAEQGRTLPAIEETGPLTDTERGRAGAAASRFAVEAMFDPRCSRLYRDNTRRWVGVATRSR